MNQGEVSEKLSRVREAIGRNGLKAVRLCGVDWFSWATGGGNSTVIMTSEVGVAEAFITSDQAFVLTNRIEARRLREEEIPGELEVQEFPWAEGDVAYRRFISKFAAESEVASDRPQGNERPLPRETAELKLTLLPSEVERYRTVCRLAGDAMKAAILRAEPNWTENDLAGEGAKEMWKRGLHPTLTLVAGERRLKIHRHPFPSSEQLGGCAMMVFCARHGGLYANLTRFIYLREPTSEEVRLHEDVAKIEAAALDASRPSAKTSEVFEALASAYRDLGYPEEILNHHQGGPCGYLSREEVAGPASLRPEPLTLKSQMAVAWNPSLPGAKIEDTCLVTERGVEILTEIEGWPTQTVNGRKRPWLWVKKG